MTSGAEDDRRWAADKRDFIADWREGVADRRDSIEDERERLLDVREAELNRWALLLEARALELELASDTSEAARCNDFRIARGLAAEERSRARDRRDREDSARREASQDRLKEARPTLLALAFADIAQQLYSAANVDDVLRKIAESAVSMVAGCRMASITVSGPGGYTTAACTDPEAEGADEAQYEVGEGPSVDALRTPVVYAPAFPDDRWPALGAHPTDHGVQSAVSYHLSASSPATPAVVDGALTAYGLEESAFDDAAREIGLVLAAHASGAIRAVAQRHDLEDSGRELQKALMSRDVIGQAKGILMERMRITPDEAFDVLRRASQSLNIKLREVAADLAESGILPVT